jgi:arginine decarboxylase
VINVIPLHELDSRPYYIGVFLAGAYQEILGTRHNLFGNTSVVHIDFDKSGKWAIKNEVNYSTVKEMLHYVQSDPELFMKQIHSSIAKQPLTDQESKKIKKHFENALKGHTYLKRKPS